MISTAPAFFLEEICPCITVANVAIMLNYNTLIHEIFGKFENLSELLSSLSQPMNFGAKAKLDQIWSASFLR